MLVRDAKSFADGIPGVAAEDKVGVPIINLTLSMWHPSSIIYAITGVTTSRRMNDRRINDRRMNDRRMNDRRMAATVVGNSKPHAWIHSIRIGANFVSIEVIDLLPCRTI